MFTLFGAFVLLVATAAGGTTARPAAASTVRPGQQLAALVTAHTARRAPRQSSPAVRNIASRRPITGEQTVLPVTGRATDSRGRRWLRVRLPGRPNGGLGWIKQHGTLARTTSWHLVVELGHRKLTIYHLGRPVGSFLAVVGKPATPTPTGEFFVEETVALPPRAAGAPFALALSARSDVLREFEGGPGQIALHGLAHVGGIPGTAFSHGCIRLATTAISWLASRVGPGVPVTIHS